MTGWILVCHRFARARVRGCTLSAVVPPDREGAHWMCGFGVLGDSISEVVMRARENHGVVAPSRPSAGQTTHGERDGSCGRLSSPAQRFAGHPRAAQPAVGCSGWLDGALPLLVLRCTLAQCQRGGETDRV